MYEIILIDIYLLFYASCLVYIISKDKGLVLHWPISFNEVVPDTAVLLSIITEQSPFVERYFYGAHNMAEGHPVEELAFPDCTSGLMFVEQRAIDRRSVESVHATCIDRASLFGQKLSQFNINFQHQH